MYDDSENDPGTDGTSSGGNAPAAPQQDPWTADELSQSQNWANQYYTSHGIPQNYGTAADLGNAYLQQRRNGLNHQDAMNAAPGALGWDTYQAPTSAHVDAPTAAPDYGTDGGILAQIAQWAAMPGADPSLKSDPNYWLGAIKSRGGLNAGNLQYWQDASVGPTAFFNNPNRESGGASGGGGTSTTNTSGGGGGGNIAPPNTTLGLDPDQAKADELYAYLMQRAHQSQIIDPNDPLIRSQSDSYSANLTRTGRQYLSQLAESKGAGGNIGAESRMITEKNAQAGAAHEGELIQHESDQRRQEIEQALTTGAQFLSDRQKLSLQRELATIDANMRLYQAQLQNDQFGRNLNQNQGQFDSTMSQREREFNDNLRQRAYEFDTTDEYNRSPYAHQGA